MIPNYDPREKWRSITWILDSDSLFDRFGFNDGNLFDDLSLDTEMCMPNPKELLRMTVETFLLPKLGVHIELYDANTVHNRMRAEDSFKNSFDSIEITVTGNDIFNMLDAQTI